MLPMGLAVLIKNIDSKWFNSARSADNQDRMGLLGVTMDVTRVTLRFIVY